MYLVYVASGPGGQGEGCGQVQRGTSSLALFSGIFWGVVVVGVRWRVGCRLAGGVRCGFWGLV